MYKRLFSNAYLIFNYVKIMTDISLYNVAIVSEGEMNYL